MNGEVLPMRLFIQIPCLNEEKTLPLVLEHMPKEIPGIDDIQLLIIDDGCSDNTVEVARSLGVQHVVHHAKPMGLARAFRDGVDYALKHGADIVVNTDGDNQYPSSAIGELVQPIVRHEADIVVGDRQTAKIAEFSWFKKRMQAFGSWVVNQAAGTHIPGCRQWFPGIFKELPAQAQHRHRVQLLHGNHHSGRQQAYSDHVVRHHHQPEDPRIPSVLEHLRAHGQVGRRDYPQLPDVQVERDLQVGGNRIQYCRLDSDHPIPGACVYGYQRRPPPVPPSGRGIADDRRHVPFVADYFRSAAYPAQARGR